MCCRDYLDSVCPLVGAWIKTGVVSMNGAINVCVCHATNLLADQHTPIANNAVHAATNKNIKTNLRMRGCLDCFLISSLSLLKVIM